MDGGILPQSGGVSNASLPNGPPRQDSSPGTLVRMKVTQSPTVTAASPNFDLCK